MKKILVVDDEAGFRSQIALSLERAGYDVVVAGSGREAVEVGLFDRPDLLITDWMLGDHVHGLNVVDAIRSVQPEVQSIVMTGFASEDLRRKAGQMDVFEFIEKPFDITKLKEIVESASNTPKPPTKTPQVALVETDSQGRILYATPDAKQLFREMLGEGPIENLADCFLDGEVPRLESAEKRWVELRPSRVRPQTNQNPATEPIWFLRAKQSSDAQRRMYVILTEEERPYQTYSLLSLILGLPTPGLTKFDCREHILLVERDEMLRKLSSEALGELECVCHTAESAAEAMEIYSKDKEIAYVLLDSESVDDMQQFVRELRNQKPEVKIIGASADKFSRHRFAAVGVKEFMRKPWVMYDLVSAIRNSQSEAV